MLVNIHSKDKECSSRLRTSGLATGGEGYNPFCG